MGDGLEELILVLVEMDSLSVFFLLNLLVVL